MKGEAHSLHVGQGHYPDSEHEILENLRGVRVDWSATPQTFLAPCHQEIRTQEDWEKHMRTVEESVGVGFFFCSVRNMSAELALFYSTRPGYWETMIIPQRYSPLLQEDLERSVEAAGGYLNWSGLYPLDELSVDKLKMSHLGTATSTVLTSTV